MMISLYVKIENRRATQSRTSKFVDVDAKTYRDVALFFPSFNPTPATSYLILFVPGCRVAPVRNTASRVEMEARSMEVEGGDC